MNAHPGRACPLDYRYEPVDLARATPLEAEHIYVVGGLYGNVEALTAIEAMRGAEARAGRDVRVIFNGDFHWFDADPQDFEQVARTVQGHWCCTGNVERELTREDDRIGCGCAYPQFVDDAVVERSNRIIGRLRATAQQFPAHARFLNALPRFLRIRMGGQAIGVVHGDSWSLSGWRFSLEALRDASDAGWPAEAQSLDAAWAEADVLAFCSSHSCLPAAVLRESNGAGRLLLNNGSSGMPNFRGDQAGLLTRISTCPDIPPGSLYGATSKGLRFDTLPIRYDHEAWCQRFLRQWAAGSDAYQSYWRRIVAGPSHHVDNARFGGLSRAV